MSSEKEDIKEHSNQHPAKKIKMAVINEEEEEEEEAPHTEVGESERIKNYEYLDHTADVKLHAWGDTLKDAFENVVVAMFDYITDLDTIAIDPDDVKDIEAEGHDLQSLLYSFMDECLFQFNGDYFVVKECKISEFDLEKFKITAQVFGETFDLQKHPQGTEVKAITYSAMNIVPETEDGNAEVGVIIDI